MVGQGVKTVGQPVKMVGQGVKMVGQPVKTVGRGVKTVGQLHTTRPQTEMRPRYNECGYLQVSPFVWYTMTGYGCGDDAERNVTE